MDLMDAIGRLLPVVLAGMPRWIEDAKKLAEAIRTHPDEAVRGGAIALEQAIKAAEKQPSG